MSLQNAQQPAEAADKWPKFMRAAQISSSSLSFFKNFSAAFEKIWYFFHTILGEVSMAGSKGRKHSALPPPVFISLSANVNHFFTLLGKMFFTPYGKEFFIYLSKQIFTS